MLAVTEAGAAGLLQLPKDVIVRIAFLLDPADVGRIACTCKTLHHIVNDEAVWQGMCTRYLPIETAPTQWLQHGHTGDDAGDQWPPYTYRCDYLEYAPSIVWHQHCADHFELV
jgi:hypothetical protein